jgi:hypothetical protein
MFRPSSRSDSASHTHSRRQVVNFFRAENKYCISAEQYRVLNAEIYVPSVIFSVPFLCVWLQYSTENEKFKKILKKTLEIFRELC